MDLIAQTGKHPAADEQDHLRRDQDHGGEGAVCPKQAKMQVLNGWTQAFFDKIDNLKFLGYVGADGYPVIIPLIQAQALDAEHLIFSFGAFGDELARHPGVHPGGGLRHGADHGRRAGARHLPGQQTRAGDEMRRGAAGLGLQPHAAQAAADLPRGAARGGEGVLGR